MVFTVLQCLDVYFTDWLTFVGTSDLVKSLGEGPRVQEEEDRRGDGDQRDQLAQPEIRKESTFKRSTIRAVSWTQLTRYPQDAR